MHPDAIIKQHFIELQIVAGGMFEIISSQTVLVMAERIKKYHQSSAVHHKLVEKIKIEIGKRFLWIRDDYSVEVV
jgi:hypothetical protein